MTLFNKVFSSLKEPLAHEWVVHFNELERTQEFPMSLALRTLEEVEENALGDESEFRRCLLEDIIFNNISTYFYEDLVGTIAENPDVAQELLDQFSERSEETDREIAEETALHSAFIENESHCDGCSSCDKHKEFAHLIAPWVREDSTQLIKEYLLVKTLYFAYEQILFDVLPSQKERLDQISSKDVELFKNHVKSFVERKLTTI